MLVTLWKLNRCHIPTYIAGCDNAKQAERQAPDHGEGTYLITWEDHVPEGLHDSEVIKRFTVEKK